MAKSLIAPWVRIFLVNFVLVPGTMVFLIFFYSLENVVPLQLLRGTNMEVACRFLTIACLPMVLLVLSIATYRGLTVFGNTLHKEEETLFLRVSKMILNNTTEQTLVFTCNILCSAVLKSLSKEKIALSALLHFFARIVYWISYLGGSYFDFTVLRAPGFVVNLLNSLFLTAVNLEAFYSLTNS